MIQPNPMSKNVNVILPGVMLSFKVESKFFFPHNFSVTVLNDYGTVLVGGTGEQGDRLKKTYRLVLDETIYSLETTYVGNAPYGMSQATLYPYKGNVVAVAGD